MKMREGSPQFLSGRSRQQLEATHRRALHRPAEEALPWSDPAFSRRFTILTDVRRAVWGSPGADVQRVLNRLITGRRHATHVADLCCGAGRHSLALAAAGLHVTGLDVSPYAIRRARGRLSALPPRVRARARFLLTDVLAPPPTDPADAVVLLGEQGVHFSPDEFRRLFAVWRERLTAGGAVVVEIPIDLPTYSDELFYLPEPLFLDGPCWTRYTLDPDPLRRAVIEIYTCLAPGARRARSFSTVRRFYRPRELAALSGADAVEVMEVGAEPPRAARWWVVLRWKGGGPRGRATRGSTNKR